MVDQLIRGAGYLRRSYKGTKELEEAAKEFSDNTVEGLHRARQGADPEKLEEVSNLLPTPEEGLAQSQKRFENDPMQKLENPVEPSNVGGGAGGPGGGRQTGGNLPQPITDMLNKLANNETIPDQGLDEILSVNLLKSGESLDIKMLFNLSLDISKLKKSLNQIVL